MEFKFTKEHFKPIIDPPRRAFIFHMDNDGNELYTEQIGPYFDNRDIIISKCRRKGFNIGRTF